MTLAAKLITADVLILGGGPAGLSAAASLSRLMVPTIVFDSGRYRNAPATHMHNMVGFDHVDPSHFRAISRQQLTDRYKTNTFVDRTVTSLTKTGDGSFEATDEDGQTYEARKVILATGVRDILPDIDGFASAWGHAIFHCLFCHGFEERNSKKAGLLAAGHFANPAFATAISGMAQRLAQDVVLYTNGNETLKADLETAFAATILHVSIDSRKIARVQQLGMETDERLALYFDNGEQDALGFMAYSPEFEVNVSKAWRDDMGIELNEVGDLKLDRMGKTTCPGVFAAGDHSGMMKAVSQALFSGNVAAAGVVHELVLGK
jgi:thioredoxin reductase